MSAPVWTRDEWEAALRHDYAGIRDGQQFGLYLGERGTTWGPVIVGDVFCCDGRATTNGAECDTSCEHEHHTAEGRMACGDCGRPIVYDHDREDYRHLEDPERGCFLIAAEPAAVAS